MLSVQSEPELLLKYQAVAELRIRRDDQNKGEFTPVHCRVDFGKRDLFGDGEHRRIKGIGQPLGQLRIVFIDNGDRRPGERIGSSLIGDIHTQRK